MNKKTPYQKQSVMWSYALLLKTRELAQLLIEKKKSLISESLNMLFKDRIQRVSGIRY
ncbi:hypothetical protein Mpsy_0396 [Methanolobus psychrophilus R15]|nr:hypothetical protein Mpsy_0396 [Methanolobus psychrophilus R15]